MNCVSVSVAEIRFQLDEHLSSAIAVQLRNRGIDTLTAHEAGLRGAADIEHVRAALAGGRILVTIDRDYLRIAAGGRSHAGIAFLTPRTRSVGAIVDSLVLVHSVDTSEEMAERIEYL
jgi:predicted nuclease of predicted toxin-antitoxin system